MHCNTKMPLGERRLQKKLNGYYHILASGDYQIYTNLLMAGGQRLIEPDPYVENGKRVWEKEMQQWIRKLLLCKTFAALRFSRNF